MLDISNRRPTLGRAKVPSMETALSATIAKAERYVRNGIQHIVYLGDISDKPVLSYEAHEMLWIVWGQESGILLTRHVILGNTASQALLNHPKEAFAVQTRIFTQSLLRSK